MEYTEIQEYINDHDYRLIRLEFDRTVQNYINHSQNLTMYFGSVPHYPEEELLEVRFEGAGGIELASDVFDTVFQPYINISEISDLGWEDCHYRIVEIEGNFSLYCDNIKCTIGY
ncbi:MAG: hypothetical protein IJ192_06690 [Clostridia bacterium]|nr:hypothetical protein [Clostridia bacterium]